MCCNPIVFPSCSSDGHASKAPAQGKAKVGALHVGIDGSSDIVFFTWAI